jgi:alpha-1,3-mannosyltransferase
VRFAQYIYGVLYLTTLVLSCAIYGAAGNVPNWIVLLLPLSKRLHSIFVLRLFNDCWAVVAVQCAIILFQYGLYDTGMMFFRCGLCFAMLLTLIQTFQYSAALSVKMSILLYLPGLLVVVFLRQGMRATLDKLVILLVTQTMFAIPFLREDPLAYLRSAFDLGRVFLYKWTVNWRLFSEEVFLSKRFAIALLLGHLSVLVAFGLFRWCERDGGVYRVLLRGFRRPMRPASLGLVTADCECPHLGVMIPHIDVLCL